MGTHIGYIWLPSYRPTRNAVSQPMFDITYDRYDEYLAQDLVEVLWFQTHRTVKDIVADRVTEIQ